MRLRVVYLVLLGLAAGSVASGQLRVGLAIAAAKTLLLAWELMELRSAHRAHAVAFAGWVLVVTGALALLSSGSG